MKYLVYGFIGGTSVIAGALLALWVYIALRIKRMDEFQWE